MMNYNPEYLELLDKISDEDLKKVINEVNIDISSNTQLNETSKKDTLARISERGRQNISQKAMNKLQLIDKDYILTDIDILNPLIYKFFISPEKIIRYGKQVNILRSELGKFAIGGFEEILKSKGIVNVYINPVVKNQFAQFKRIAEKLKLLPKEHFKDLDSVYFLSPQQYKRDLGIDIPPNLRGEILITEKGSKIMSFPIRIKPRGEEVSFGDLEKTEHAIVHELGHIVSANLTKRQANRFNDVWEELIKQIQKDESKPEYFLKLKYNNILPYDPNALEVFSEGYSQYINNPKRLKKLFPGLYSYYKNEIFGYKEYINLKLSEEDLEDKLNLIVFNPTNKTNLIYEFLDKNEEFEAQHPRDKSGRFIDKLKQTILEHKLEAMGVGGIGLGMLALLFFLKAKKGNKLIPSVIDKSKLQETIIKVVDDPIIIKEVKDAISRAEDIPEKYKEYTLTGMSKTDEILEKLEQGTISGEDLNILNKAGVNIKDELERITSIIFKPGTLTLDPLKMLYKLEDEVKQISFKEQSNLFKDIYPILSNKINNLDDFKLVFNKYIEGITSLLNKAGKLDEKELSMVEKIINEDIDLIVKGIKPLNIKLIKDKVTIDARNGRLFNVSILEVNGSKWNIPEDMRDELLRLNNDIIEFSKVNIKEDLNLNSIADYVQVITNPESKAKFISSLDNLKDRSNSIYNRINKISAGKSNYDFHRFNDLNISLTSIDKNIYQDSQYLNGLINNLPKELTIDQKLKYFALTKKWDIITEKEYRARIGTLRVGGMNENEALVKALDLNKDEFTREIGEELLLGDQNFIFNLYQGVLEDANNIAHSLPVSEISKKEVNYRYTVNYLHHIIEKDKGLIKYVEPEYSLRVDKEGLLLPITQTPRKLDILPGKKEYWYSGGKKYIKGPDQLERWAAADIRRVEKLDEEISAMKKEIEKRVAVNKPTAAIEARLSKKEEILEKLEEEIAERQENLKKIAKMRGKDVEDLLTERKTGEEVLILPENIKVELETKIKNLEKKRQKLIDKKEVVKEELQREIDRKISELEEFVINYPKTAIGYRRQEFKKEIILPIDRLGGIDLYDNKLKDITSDNGKLFTVSQLIEKQKDVKKINLETFELDFNRRIIGILERLGIEKTGVPAGELRRVTQIEVPDVTISIGEIKDELLKIYDKDSLPEEIKNLDDYLDNYFTGGANITRNDLENPAEFIKQSYARLRNKDLLVEKRQVILDLSSQTTKNTIKNLNDELTLEDNLDLINIEDKLKQIDSKLDFHTMLISNFDEKTWELMQKIQKNKDLITLNRIRNNYIFGNSGFRASWENLQEELRDDIELQGGMRQLTLSNINKYISDSQIINIKLRLKESIDSVRKFIRAEFDRKIKMNQLTTYSREELDKILDTDFSGFLAEIETINKSNLKEFIDGTKKKWQAGFIVGKEEAVKEAGILENKFLDLLAPSLNKSLNSRELYKSRIIDLLGIREAKKQEKKLAANKEKLIDHINNLFYGEERDNLIKTIRESNNSVSYYNINRLDKFPDRNKVVSVVSDMLGTPVKEIETIYDRVREWSKYSKIKWHNLSKLEKDEALTKYFLKTELKESDEFTRLFIDKVRQEGHALIDIDFLSKSDLRRFNRLLIYNRHEKSPLLLNKNLFTLYNLSGRIKYYPIFKEIVIKNPKAMYKEVGEDIIYPPAIQRLKSYEVSAEGLAASISKDVDDDVASIWDSLGNPTLDLGLLDYADTIEELKKAEIRYARIKKRGKHEYIKRAEEKIERLRGKIYADMSSDSWNEGGMRHILQPPDNAASIAKYDEIRTGVISRLRREKQKELDTLYKDAIKPTTTGLKKLKEHFAYLEIPKPKINARDEFDILKRARAIAQIKSGYRSAPYTPREKILLTKLYDPEKLEIITKDIRDSAEALHNFTDKSYLGRYKRKLLDLGYKYPDLAPLDLKKKIIIEVNRDIVRDLYYHTKREHPLVINNFEIVEPGKDPELKLNITTIDELTKEELWQVINNEEKLNRIPDYSFYGGISMKTSAKERKSAEEMRVIEEKAKEGIKERRKLGLSEDICFFQDRWEEQEHPRGKAGKFTYKPDKVEEYRSLVIGGTALLVAVAVFAKRKELADAVKGVLSKVGFMKSSLKEEITKKALAAKDTVKDFTLNDVKKAIDNLTGLLRFNKRHIHPDIEKYAKEIDTIFTKVKILPEETSVLSNLRKLYGQHLLTIEDVKNIAEKARAKNLSVDAFNINNSLDALFPEELVRIHVLEEISKLNKLLGNKKTAIDSLGKNNPKIKLLNYLERINKDIAEESDIINFKSWITKEAGKYESEARRIKKQTLAILNPKVEVKLDLFLGKTKEEFTTDFIEEFYKSRERAAKIEKGVLIKSLATQHNIEYEGGKMPKLFWQASPEIRTRALINSLKEIKGEHKYGDETIIIDLLGDPNNIKQYKVSIKLKPPESVAPVYVAPVESGFIPIMLLRKPDFQDFRSRIKYNLSDEELMGRLKDINIEKIKTKEDFEKFLFEQHPYILSSEGVSELKGDKISIGKYQDMIIGAEGLTGKLTASIDTTINLPGKGDVKYRRSNIYGNKFIWVTLIEVTPQGKGFGNRLINDMVETSRNYGFTDIPMTAALTGRYSWLSRGWKSMLDKKGKTEDMAELLTKAIPSAREYIRSKFSVLKITKDEALIDKLLTTYPGNLFDIDYISYGLTEKQYRDLLKKILTDNPAIPESFKLTLDLSSQEEMGNFKKRLKLAELDEEFVIYL